MELSIKRHPEKPAAPAVVGVFEPRKLTPRRVGQGGRGLPSDLVRRATWTGKAVPPPGIHDVPGTPLRPGSARRAGQEKNSGKGIHRRRPGRSQDPERNRRLRRLDLPHRNRRQKRSIAWRVRQTAMAALDATYRFDAYKSKKDEVRRPCAS